MSSACKVLKFIFEDYRLFNYDVVTRDASDFKSLRARPFTQQSGLHERVDNDAGIKIHGDVL